MCHFILITFLKFRIWQDFGFQIFQSNVWSLWKEFYLFIICLLILILNFQQNKFNLKKYFASASHQKTVILIIAFSIIWLIVSFLNKLSLSTIFLGIKYDIIMLLPIIFFPMLKIDKNDLKDFIVFIVKLIKYVVFFSLIFWTIRILDPEFLKILGFGKYNTFLPWQKPPYFYGTVDTQLYSTIRESGIFAGPNVMAFFTVFTFPILFIYYISTPKEERKIWITTIFLILFLLIVSLSRTALIWLFLELLLIFYYYVFYQKTKLDPKTKKLFLGIFGIFLLMTTAWIIHWLQVWVTESFLYRMLVRSASTWWHFQNLQNGFFIFMWNVGWLWLGTAWPAAVQSWTWIVPENRWLQIFLETGIFWGIIYMFIYINILYNLYVLSQKYIKEKIIGNFYFFAIISTLAILSAGIFLHMFDDSMISLFVSGFIWIILGLKDENNNKK